MSAIVTKEGPILFSGAMVRAILEGRKTQTRRVMKKPPSEYVPSPNIHPPKHDAAYFDSYCNAQKTAQNPRGMSEFWCWWSPDNRQGSDWIRCRYGKPGDRLWVRETWEQVHPCQVTENRFSLAGEAGIPGPPAVSSRVIYRADGEYPRKHFIQQYPYRDVCSGDDCQTRHLHPEEASTGWTPSIHMPRRFSRLALEIVSIKVERVQDISEADAIAEGCHQETARCDHRQFQYIEDAPYHSNARDDFWCLWDSINLDRGYGWIKNPWVWVIEFKRMGAN